MCLAEKILHVVRASVGHGADRFHHVFMVQNEVPNELEEIRKLTIKPTPINPPICTISALCARLRMER